MIIKVLNKYIVRATAVLTQTTKVVCNRQLINYKGDSLCQQQVII
ncbi:hypothetical protein UFOVP1634_5 [uncultured Caudovirales phage]|uniref:Uncharacterized protein n=1 Tax=uncultured Caudovirales phage TaxID=2100421 RepID=A0A6J5Q8K9_9CAUD|nr:hypothetical protein UFOVP1030_3 [uncultured Caudovirales phage]CAB4220256.1 hypothetical protein UFOVP1634_5 [uncultured Caudovirales phage]